MEWEFRKALESFEIYSANSHLYITEVEKGSPGVLGTLVREVQHIIGGAEQKIISKVLAMRFAKDIMILGRKDVIKALVRLVPHMLKVCSHRLQDTNPDRGETFFNEHPSYGKGDEQKRKQIQLFASTYFTLTLQSVFFWSKWIPTDQTGNESIYAKGYQSLIERGVKFNDRFHYYKDSDTERFKNTYKVEFFSQSQFMDIQSQNTSRTSKILQQSQEMTEPIKKNKTPDSYKQVKQAQSILQIKSILNQVSLNEERNSSNMLSEINSRLENLLEFKYGNQYRKYSGIEKEEKKWIEKYIVNYDLLSHKKIRISQFIKRVTAESIQLKAEEEVIKQEVKDGFKKTKRTAKRETIESPIRQRTPSPFELEQQLVDKKQEDGKQRLQFYRKQLQNRDKQIDKLQKLHQQEKYCMVQDYQARIKLIKKGIMENSDDKTDYLVKENQKLKNKINQLEKSFRQNERERQLEEERIKLYHEIERLKIENQKLKAQSEIHCENIENIYIVKIEMLEKRLKQMERKNQERGKNEYSLDHFNGNDKKNKQIQGITEQLKIYKEELLNQREKFEKKQRIYDKKVAQLEAQNQSLSQTVTKMHRKIDLKELQIAQLEQQVRLYKQYDRQVNMQSDSISNQNNRYQLRSPEISIKEKTFQFKKYESLRNHYGSKKELFIRFCRCSLRKKDIILKQNQLEVGLITEPLSQNQIKFVIHFTNMSEVQFNNIELNIERPSHINVQASSLFLLCLHRQMQQKITIRCTQNKVLSKIYEPIILNITFSKRNVPHKLKVNLPFLLLKTLQFYKPNQNNNNNLWHEHGYNLALHYSKKILPNSGYLKNYFEKMEETSTGVLECEAFQRASGLKFRIGIRILIEGEGMIMIQAIPIKGKQKWSQQYEDIIEDFMGFMEFVFRK